MRAGFAPSSWPKRRFVGVELHRAEQLLRAEVPSAPALSATEARSNTGISVLLDATASLSNIEGKEYEDVQTRSCAFGR